MPQGGSRLSDQVADVEVPGSVAVGGARRRRLPTIRRERGLIWPIGFVTAGVFLFAIYLAQARSMPVTSDGASNALQAWDMLHGNLLLHGWVLTDVSFYTTELPEYMLVELVRGLGISAAHIAAALTYTLVVIGAALLAKGQAQGREGVVRALVAAGILFGPPMVNASTLLSNPDHTGTQVPFWPSG